jgi:hypothetical protein
MNFAIDTFPPERFGRVSGSRCSPLVPKRDAKVGMITLAKELASERYFQTFAEVSTWQMEHGKMAQHFAHEHYKTYFDDKVQDGVYGSEGELSWSTDAELTDYGIDYKAPTSLDKFNDYLFDGISDYEFNQAQFYIMKRKKPIWLICPYLIEHQKMTDNGLTYPIPEKQRMLIIEVKESKEWQDKFYSNLPFVIEQRDTFIEMLKLKFPK